MHCVYNWNCKYSILGYSLTFSITTLFLPLRTFQSIKVWLIVNTNDLNSLFKINMEYLNTHSISSVTLYSQNQFNKIWYCIKLLNTHIKLLNKIIAVHTYHTHIYCTKNCSFRNLFYYNCTITQYCRKIKIDLSLL